MEKILIVDDDVAISYLISDALEDEGFKTTICHSGDQAKDILAQGMKWSMILLDIMMPGMDGLELCRKIRDDMKCPIIFVSAKSRTLDTLLGLEMGADDYICKPFIVEELVARVKAHLRRERRYSQQQLKQETNLLKFHEIILHLDRYEVFINEESVDLSPREFQLLQYLIENQGQVLSREQIFDAVWGNLYGDIGTVAVNIKNLRAKLDPNHQMIKTVWGVGYKLVKPSGEQR